MIETLSSYKQTIPLFISDVVKHVFTVMFSWTSWLLPRPTAGHRGIQLLPWSPHPFRPWPGPGSGSGSAPGRLPPCKKLYGLESAQHSLLLSGCTVKIQKYIYITQPHLFCCKLYGQQARIFISPSLNYFTVNNLLFNSTISVWCRVHHGKGERLLRAGSLYVWNHMCFQKIIIIIMKWYI